MKKIYKKMSFDISEKNYDYLIKMKKNTNMSAGSFLNIILDSCRTKGTAVSTYAIKLQLLDKKINILEKDLQELKDFKKELLENDNLFCKS